MNAFFKYLCVLTISMSHLHASEKLHFLNDITLSTGTIYNETEIGGLSGLTYDAKTNRLLAISDDRSYVNPSRFYEFDLLLTEKTFSVTPVAVVFLKDEKNNFFAKGETDFEAISLVNDLVYVSSEGNLDPKKLIQPELYIFKRNGEFVKKLEIPKNFLVQPNKANYGSRENLSFEALSTTKDSQTTFLGSEEALIQDGPMSSTTFGSIVRIVKYQKDVVVAQYAYQLEKIQEQIVPNLPADQIKAGDNGLVDIAAIDENNFYTLERSYLPSARKNVIRIFKNQIDSKTSNISKLDSLLDKSFKPITKTLIADLEGFVPLMNYKKLDNIEAITFGPLSSKGLPTLIVASDNNFRAGQRTMFMAFEIVTE